MPVHIPQENEMRRTVATLTLAMALLLPATSAFAAPGNGNGPRYTCTSFGSVYYGATPGTAKQLERSGYVCVRSN
jgi:hypothetical protein